MFHQKWISLLSVGPWNRRTVAPSPVDPPRNAEDTSPPHVTALPACVGVVPVSRTCRSSEQRPPRKGTDDRACSDRDTFRFGWRHLERDGSCHLRFRAFRCGALDQLPIDGQNPHIVQHGLAGYAARWRYVRTILRLCQDQIDSVAWPDQPRKAGDRIDPDGDRAHARSQHRGKETAITRIERVTQQQRIALGQVAPDHGSQQIPAGRAGIDSCTSRNVSSVRAARSPDRPASIRCLRAMAGRQSAPATCHWTLHWSAPAASPDAN